jgi:hypothetical protein
MKVEITGDKLTLDLRDIFDGITDPDVLMEIAQRIGCHGKVLEAVAQQIVNRCTDEGWHGMTASRVDSYATGMDAAIRMVILAREDVCKREHLRLEEALNYERDRAKKALDELHYSRRDRSMA